MSASNTTLRKITTGVEGLDEVLRGGLPALSVNIVTGRPGTGKTILTHQIIFANLESNQRALYLTTLAEPSLKMLRYLQEFHFTDPERMGQDLVYFDIGEAIQEKGLSETIGLILEKVKEFQPAIVAVDSFKAIHDMASDPAEIRKFGFDLAVTLTAWGVTAFLIGEYSDEDIQREPIFAVADSIISLRYVPLGLHYQRFVDVLKLRGSDYFAGWHPYKITADGLTVYPRIKTPDVVPEYKDSQGRLKSGLPKLDEMLGGGLPLGSSTMIAGGAGTGKTLLGSHFVTQAAARNEPSVIVSFQENPNQLTRISRSFGWDFEELKRRDLVTHLYHSPVELQPDIHFSEVRRAVDRTGAQLVLIDSLKDLEIATPDKIRYKDYIYSLINELKAGGITALVTNEIPELFGPFQLSEFGVSFIADNVILLRYVELAGRMSRAVNVLKVRGSQHSKEIYEFEVTGEGVQILEPIRAFSGVLTGTPLASERLSVVHLPPRARYVVETLRHVGPSDAKGIVDATGMNAELVAQELKGLHSQGLVAVIPREGCDMYHAVV